MLNKYKFGNITIKSIHSSKHLAVLQYTGWTHGELRVIPGTMSSGKHGPHRGARYLRTFHAPKDGLLFGTGWRVVHYTHRKDWKWKWVVVDNNNVPLKGKNGKTRHFSAPANAIMAAEKAIRTQLAWYCASGFKSTARP